MHLEFGRNAIDRALGVTRAFVDVIIASRISLFSTIVNILLDCVCCVSGIEVECII